MSIRLLTEVGWSGAIPGYGDASRRMTAVSVPNVPEMRFGDGSRVALPEPANYVEVSQGGKWAWQGHESGLIYEGLTSTGKKGYGQHSFLYVGEELRIFTDVETYQQTGGGWWYVDEAGTIVGYGAKYTGSRDQAIPWNRTEFADGVMIGQGPDDNDGVVVSLPPAPNASRVFRQLVAGDAHDIHVRRYGDAFLIAVTLYAEHVTRVYAVDTLEDLAALPTLVSTVPVQPPAPPVQVQPPPVQEPTPVTTFANHLDTLTSVRAKYPALVTADQAVAILNEVAWIHRDEGFGLLRKDGGNHGAQPTTGIPCSVDWLVNSQTGTGFDAGGDGPDATSGTPGADNPQWSDGVAFDTTKFVAPVEPQAATVPNPQPSTPPASSAPGVTVEQMNAAIAVAVAAARAELSERIDAVDAKPATVPHGAPVTVKVKGRIPGLSVKTINGTDVEWTGTGAVD